MSLSLSFVPCLSVFVSQSVSLCSSLCPCVPVCVPMSQSVSLSVQPRRNEQCGNGLLHPLAVCLLHYSPPPPTPYPHPLSLPSYSLADAARRIQPLSQFLGSLRGKRHDLSSAGAANLCSVPTFFRSGVGLTGGRGARPKKTSMTGS